jgi:hypothetical protein
MSATVTSIATGPRTPQGKANSALNALTHGLTAKSPVLPSEMPAQFEAFRAAVLDRFAPQAPEDVASVLEYIDATWRLRRIALHEAELITLEIKRMQDDPALAQLLPTLTATASEALAVERLFASKALVNLHRLEDRLSRRLARVKPIIDFLGERANEREYLRRQAEAQAKVKVSQHQQAKLALVPTPTRPSVGSSNVQNELPQPIDAARNNISAAEPDKQEAA